MTKTGKLTKLERLFGLIPYNAVPCVYFLKKCGVIQYIGSTFNLRSRISQHRKRRIIPFNSVSFIISPDYRAIENRAIKKYNPFYNKNCTPRQRDAFVKKYKAWDWTLRDVELSEKHGVTREYVRQIRKRLKECRAHRHSQHRRFDHVTEILLSLPRPVDIDAAAKQIGISIRAARHQCRKFKIPMIRKKNPNHKYDWKNANWSMSNIEIGKQLNAPAQIVASYRYSHQITTPHKKETKYSQQTMLSTGENTP